jgi:hypothetical protein
MTEFELELARFCKALQAALASETRPEWFEPSAGLCENIYSWIGGYGAHTSEALAAQDKLQELFALEYTSISYPFDSGSWIIYNIDANLGILYTNPRRLAFIAKWAALAP